MTYHPLANDTGQSAERRAEEAHDIIHMINDRVDQMEPHESKFIADMQERDQCTPKQLFWLRDLKEKYL